MMVPKALAEEDGRFMCGAWRIVLAHPGLLCGNKSMA
jgi:hypothetical protein